MLQGVLIDHVYAIFVLLSDLFILKKNEIYVNRYGSGPQAILRYGPMNN